ncbi:alanine racemase [Brevundimonas aveniformis]|uniref:alanine racemase n=1 Tax=Brevundimonas aveniformis TaxID=370977 RepID=UPI0004288336|nr:alanine racemase [Brevundimonas aveniformis]
MPSPARLIVDLNALSANFHTLARIGGVPVHPVVKADAYGLGAAAVARKLMTEGADTFFVARLSEGEALRQTLGSRPNIYVLDGCGPNDVLRLQAARLRPVLNAPEQIRRWLGSDGGPSALQIDTGMNRLGIRPEDAPEPFPGLEIVLSHLACADDPFDALNTSQRSAFELVSRRYPGVVRSFANAGGTFLGADFAFDALRPGISLYGGGPEGRPDDRLRPVAAFRADVIQIRDVPEGETVGYARGFTAEHPTALAIVSVGYADGVLRSNYPNGKVWVGDALRPIIGRISMDLIAVDITGLKVSPGDTVELFGPYRMIDDAAADAGTIAYELITSVSTRVPRVYVG